MYQKSCFYNSMESYGDTELALVADIMMARAKRIYILIIKVSFSVFLFSSRCFIKEIKITSDSVSVSSDFNIETLVKVWKNSKKLWKHSPVVWSYSHSISRSNKLPLAIET